jgi:hypothetical protein
MKNILLFTLLISMLSACAATGPAEDQWDREEKEDKISIGSIFGKSKKSAPTQAENEALRARIERLERQQGLPAGDVSADPKSSSDITAPPPLGTNTGGYQPSSPQDSVSYQEWLRAKQSNSDDYKAFKEYQEWLEFQKMKQKR